MILDDIGGKVVTAGDEFEALDIGISEEHIAHIFRDVTTYSNPIGSVVREITSNCFDSHKRAGVTVDVEIVMIKGNKLNNYYDQIQFKDFGTGLSKEKIKEIFLKIGASDKRDGNSEIGGFGRGSKSPFGYIRDKDIDGFYLDTWYDGTHTKYFLIETDQGPQMINMIEESSNRTNGTTVTVPIESGDWDSFQNEIKKQLAYFDNIRYKNCGVESNNYRIYQTDNIIYRTDYQPYDELHVCHGKVAYPLDFDAIGENKHVGYGHNKSERFSSPIALRFDIGELSVTPSRESLNYNDKTISNIKEKLKETRNELQELYDAQYENVDSVKKYISFCYNRKTDIIIDDTVVIPASKGLINSEDPKYPKYDDINLPTSPYQFFRKWHNYKSVDDVGHINKYSNGNSINNLINNNKNYTFIVENKYSTRKNKYMCSSFGEDLNKMYLVREELDYKLKFEKDYKYCSIDYDDLTDEDKKTILYCKTHPSIDINFTGRNPTPIEKARLWESFYKEIDDLVRSTFRSYSDIEVSDKYKEHLKKQRKKKRSNKKDKNDKFPLKIIESKGDSYYGLDFKWSMIDWKYKNINPSHTYIYGFSNDDEKLLSLGEFWYGNKQLSDHNLVHIIKIAMSREELFEDLPHSYHIDDFMKRKLYDSFFVKPVIAAWLYKHKPSYSINKHLKRNNIFNEYDTSFPSTISYTDVLHTNIGKKILDYYNLTDNPYTEESIFKYKFQLIEGIKLLEEENYKLLDKIEYYHWKDESKKIEKEIDFYIQCKDANITVDPALYYRLNK